MSTEEDTRYEETTVRPDDLFTHTSVGWEVVERFEFDEPISFQEKMYSDGSAYSSGQRERVQIGRSVGFRVRRAVNSPISRLTKEVDNLRAEFAVETVNLEKASKALEAERREHQQTKNDLKWACTQNDQARKEREKIEAIKRQLEADLGRVREYLGRKVFEEILPPKPKQEGV